MNGGPSSPWGEATALASRGDVRDRIAQRAGGGRAGAAMLARVDTMVRERKPWYADQGAAVALSQSLKEVTEAGGLRAGIGEGTRTQLGYGATGTVTVPGGGGTATLTLSVLQFGIGADLTIEHNGAVGDIEITSLSHNNDLLTVGQVPPEVWAPESLVRPPIYRSFRPADTLTIQLVNSNAAARTVSAFIGAIPISGKPEQALRQVLQEGATRIMAWGPQGGFASIGAGATGTFQILTIEPGIASRLCVLGGGGGNIIIPSFTINNNPFLSGIASAGSFRPTAWTNQGLYVGVDPSSNVIVQATNTSAGALDVCPVLLATPLVASF